LKITQ
jgi:hypothetical protein